MGLKFKFKIWSFLKPFYCEKSKKLLKKLFLF